MASSKRFSDELDEQFVDDVWTELKRRRHLYGENPPFYFDSDSEDIESSVDSCSNPAYIMCLILSMFGNPNDPAATSDATGKLFEELSAYAVKNYLNGESVIYGHQPQCTLREIAKRMNEQFWDEPPPNYKDRGVDVISWKSFGDGRPSQIVILSQCAAGHDWKDKLNDVPYRRWCAYIHWACFPLTGFVLPIIAPADETEFLESSGVCGLLIDRARIYRNTLSTEFQGDLRERIKNWCEQKLDEYCEKVDYGWW